MSIESSYLSPYRIDAAIVGAEKAGTTSIGYYLAQHPVILTHFNKLLPKNRRVLEFSVFHKEEWRDREVFSREYLNAFQCLPTPDDIVVAKNVGIMHLSSVARNLKEHSPDCKIIASLRNPVDRAYSSFWYQRYRGEESLDSFESAINHELLHGPDEISHHRRYLKKGHYCEQLEHMVELFGRKNVHVVLFEDLKKSPRETLLSIFQFLGVSECEVKSIDEKNSAKAVKWPKLAQYIKKESSVKKVVRTCLPFHVRHQVLQRIRSANSITKKPPHMSDETRLKLIEYFRPYNKDLEAFLGRDLSHWNN